jgi:hypothetical protein
VHHDGLIGRMGVADLATVVLRNDATPDCITAEEGPSSDSALTASTEVGYGVPTTTS